MTAVRLASHPIELSFIFQTLDAFCAKALVELTVVGRRSNLPFRLHALLCRKVFVGVSRNGDETACRIGGAYCCSTHLGGVGDGLWRIVLARANVVFLPHEDGVSSDGMEIQSCVRGGGSRASTTGERKTHERIKKCCYLDKTNAKKTRGGCAEEVPSIHTQGKANPAFFGSMLF